jgi:hypothetical protein
MLRSHHPHRHHPHRLPKLPQHAAAAQAMTISHNFSYTVVGRMDLLTSSLS